MNANLLFDEADKKWFDRASERLNLQLTIEEDFANSRSYDIRRNGEFIYTFYCPSPDGPEISNFFKLEKWCSNHSRREVGRFSTIYALFEHVLYAVVDDTLIKARDNA